MRQYLLLPAPTPLPDEVLQASARQMVNHRGPEFSRLLAELLDGLREVLLTRAPILPFASSGTGGLEAAIVNLCSPGDVVIAASSGWFGERFADITPFTPAIGVIHALHASVRLLLGEGMEARFARHRCAARAVRAGVRTLGLRVVPREQDASETVTAVWLPPGADAKTFLGAAGRPRGRLWRRDGRVCGQDLPVRPPGVGDR